MRRITRRITGGASALVALILLFNAACAGRQPVREGVARVNKPIMRRGGVLETDITRFLQAGYLLLDAEARYEPTFIEASGEATKKGRGIGAHLIAVYEGLEPAALAAAEPPLFMGEPPFSAERFANQLRTLEPSTYTIFYWSRPNTPIPLGVFFHPTLPADTRAALGETPAVQIRAIIRGSPASRGYLLNGDVVTHVDGEVVPRDPAALIERLTPKRGNRVTFTVLRDGDPQDKIVALFP